jgi:hypothetical protein
VRSPRSDARDATVDQSPDAVAEIEPLRFATGEWAQADVILVEELIVADRIVATTIRKVKKPYVWPDGGGAVVRNRIVRVDPSTGSVVPE